MIDDFSADVGFCDARSVEGFQLPSMIIAIH